MRSIVRSSIVEVHPSTALRMRKGGALGAGRLAPLRMREGNALGALAGISLPFWPTTP